MGKIYVGFTYLPAILFFRLWRLWHRALVYLLFFRVASVIGPRSLCSLVRHHTYFSHQSSVNNNTESSVGGQSKSRRAVSLLTHSRELDNSCPSDTVCIILHYHFYGILL